MPSDDEIRLLIWIWRDRAARQQKQEASYPDVLIRRGQAIAYITAADELANLLDNPESAETTARDMLDHELTA